jgi:succinate-acetate transporter protein
MAVGNTFGATTFTSFGAYWVTFALISTFEDPNAVADATNATCQNETLTGLFMLVGRFQNT